MWQLYLNSLGGALRISLCCGFTYFHCVVVLLRPIKVFVGSAIIFHLQTSHFALKVNMDVNHKSTMEDILNKVGLSEFLQRFIAEKVEPERITAATDMDLIRLEVAAIGDRVRLREACRKREDEPHQSDTNARNSEKRLLFQPRISEPYRRLA